uniref:Uncharacterized protein n=1 Tax=Noctiluca scintillans TaxID=2966 RepID=A0A7S0ZV64_NOCSC
MLSAVEIVVKPMDVAADIEAFYAHLTSMLHECDVAELDDWFHFLLQWELLTLLGDQRVAAQSSALSVLLQPSSKDMLEILLSSGGCGPQAGGGASHRSTEPRVVAARWRAALLVLSRVLASDLLARGSSWRYRLAVAVALTFCHEDLPLTLMATGDPIDPCQRYHDFTAWAESGELHASFVDQSAWAMRYVVGTWCASEELEWARTHAEADKSDRRSLATAGHRMVR